MPLVCSYHTLSPVTEIAPPSGVTLLGPHYWSGRLLSVALASESLRLGITQQPTLWSPDFPLALLQRQRTPVYLQLSPCYNGV